MGQFFVLVALEEGDAFLQLTYYRVRYGEGQGFSLSGSQGESSPPFVL
jgi:hypothetical protein